MASRRDLPEHGAMAADCFCGCGTRVPRFPLGMRSVNKRGELVLDRLQWARRVLGDEPPEDFDTWYEEGEEIVNAIADAMHGDRDVRELDERAIRHWQEYGRSMERVARSLGAPGVRANNAARQVEEIPARDQLESVAWTLRDIAAANCPEWPEEGIVAISEIALTGAMLIAELADRSELIPVGSAVQQLAGSLF